MSIPPFLPSSAEEEVEISVSIPSDRLQVLLLAADTVGRPVEELLREAVELCVDTTAALAIHRAGYQ